MLNIPNYHYIVLVSAALKPVSIPNCKQLIEKQHYIS